MSDVVFVQMPFAGPERPSLALGLFTATLRQAGISTETVYGNLAFIEKIGLPAYFLVRMSAPTALLGEWLFSPAAFGAAAQALGQLDDPGLLADATFLEAVLRDRGQPNLDSLLADLRREACAFVAELADQVVSLRPKAVGCTSMFDQHCASLALLRQVKQRDPRIATVIGGANCAGPMGLATHTSVPELDFTATSEFDAHAADFFGALVAAGGDARRVPAPPGVLGPAERDAGRPPRVPAGVMLADMDRAAVPDYDDFFEQLYASPLSRYVLTSLPLETSRGCWWGAKQHCTFCGLNGEGMSFRVKSPQRALDEIRTLTSRYHNGRWAATDNIIDVSYFRTVLPALATDEREYVFFYETKANLKREHLQVLAEAGCSYIQPGIESLHDETLRLMRKGTTACRNIQLLKHCLEVGVTPAWNILCGLPGSDPEWVAEVAAALPALFHLPPPNGTSPINFDRFSPYHQNPGAWGLRLEPSSAYGRIYPFEAAVLEDLAYFFREAGGTPTRVLQTARISGEATARWKARFWGPERPELVIEHAEPELVRVRDTREGSRVHELQGLAARLLGLLETATTPSGLESKLRQVGGADAGGGAVSSALGELIERRLVWRSSSEYVALPTLPPRRPLPRTAEMAVGRVDLAKYYVEKVRFRRALAPA